MKTICLLILTVVCFTSCKAPKDFVFHNVEHFGLGQTKLSQTRVSMNVVMYNPNSYKMRLKKADLDIYLNNNHLGKMNVSRKYRVPAMDTFSLPVIIDVDLKNVLPNAIALFLSGDVNVKLAGHVKAGRHGVYLNIPVNYEGKQDIRSGLKF